MALNFKHILLATDGSPEAEKAYEQAVALAKLVQAKLYIAQVVEPIYFEGMVRDLPEIRQRAKDNVAQLAQRAKAQGLNEVETIVVEGRAREALAHDLPKQYDADLIVISATGRSRAERLLLGSVSEYVIRRAHIEVLVVRDKQFNEAH